MHIAMLYPPQEAFSFVAKHDYSDEREGNLSFLMGDQLYIISMSGDFCLARSLRTGTVGLIPSNYAAKWNDLESNAYVAVTEVVITLILILLLLLLCSYERAPLLYNTILLLQYYYYLHLFFAICNSNIKIFSRNLYH